MAGRCGERGGRPLIPVTDLHRFLTGRWTLDRTLTAPGGERIGTFHGTGTFTADGTALHYRETGELRLPGHRAPASRELRYTAFDGPRCTVLFAGPGSAEPGAPFHDLDLGTGHWRVQHPCRADRYHGEFTVLGADTWIQEWTVTGPAKSYRSVTTLARVTR